MSKKRNKKHKRIADEAQFESDRRDASPENFGQYRKYIEVFDLSDAEQRKLVRALQDIVDSFIRLGWDRSEITVSPQPRCEGGGA